MQVRQREADTLSDFEMIAEIPTGTGWAAVVDRGNERVA